MLLANARVADVAAVAMPDEIMGEKVCVYIVPRPGETLTLEDVTSYVKEQGIAVYKFPERLEIIDAIPRNPVGKILKTKLREDLKAKMAKEGKLKK